MDTETPLRISLGAKGRGHLTGAAALITASLFILPLLLILFKLSVLPGSETVRNLLSLSELRVDVSQHMQMVVFVPLAALLIVIFRVTLGIRVLGPFRSILLAVAFQVTGITIGLVFLTLVVIVITAVRPSLRAIRLPYFARVAVALSVVVAMVVVVIEVGKLLDIRPLTDVAYLPIVVLCLTGDGFARTLNREGIRSALWRGGMTALAAVTITWLAAIDLLAALMMRFPELILVQVGMIIVISEYFGFRLLAFLNPPPVKRRSKTRQKQESDELHRQPELSACDSSMAGDVPVIDRQRKE